MYGIREDEIRVNGVNVGTFSREISGDHASLEVETGTTGFRGGHDRASGSRLYVGFFCGNGDLLFRPVRNQAGTITGVEIAACGDEALDALMKSLEFAVKALGDQFGNVKD